MIFHYLMTLTAHSFTHSRGKASYFKLTAMPLPSYKSYLTCRIDWYERQNYKEGSEQTVYSVSVVIPLELLILINTLLRLPLT
jgi:hypothetical protein